MSIFICLLIIEVLGNPYGYILPIVVYRIVVTTPKVAR